MTRGHQKDFPAEQPEAQAAPRVPRAHGDQERPESARRPSRQGPQASERLTGGESPVTSSVTSQNTPPLEVLRLKVRREFLFVAEGEMYEHFFAHVVEPLLGIGRRKRGLSHSGSLKEDINLFFFLYFLA